MWEYEPYTFLDDFAEDEGNDTLKDYSLDLLGVSRVPSSVRNGN